MTVSIWIIQSENESILCMCVCWQLPVPLPVPLPFIAKRNYRQFFLSVPIMVVFLETFSIITINRIATTNITWNGSLYELNRVRFNGKRHEKTKKKKIRKYYEKRFPKKVNKCELSLLFIRKICWYFLITGRCSLA